MTPHRVNEMSLRLDRPEVKKLVWAFVISVLIHLLCYGTYELGKEYGVWRKLQVPAWLQKMKLFASVPQQPRKPSPPREVPLMFVDVDPQQATLTPPEDAKFYSDKNSKAANPDAEKDTGVPKITGKQPEVAKAEDVKRAPFDKLQPDFKALQKQQEEEHARPQSPKPIGDLTMAKPDLHLRQDTGTAEDSRPRTIAEALRRLHRNQLVGQKMKQDGGVGRLRLEASFDAKATPFGAYDAAFIEAVQSRWYDLLDNVSYDGYRRGKVTLQFHLGYDGQITDLKVVGENVGMMLTLMCQKAVQDPAPYDPWPREMRLLVDKDYRDITFTFFYN